MLLLPDSEIDGSGHAPDIGAVVLFGNRFHDDSNNRGVALEVAGPSISETDITQHLIIIRDDFWVSTVKV